MRIAVTIPDSKLAHWQEACITRLTEENDVDVVAFLSFIGEKPTAINREFRFPESLTIKAERFLVGSSFPAYKEGTIPVALSELPVISLEKSSGLYTPGPDNIDALKDLAIDLVIHLAAGIPDVDLFKLAKSGWLISSDWMEQLQWGRPVGFSEVVRGTGQSRVKILQITWENELVSRTVLNALDHVDLRSVSRTRNQVLMNLSAWFVYALRNLDATKLVQPFSVRAQNLASFRRWIDTGFVPVHIAKWVLNRVRQMRKKPKWELGLAKLDYDYEFKSETLKDVQIIPTPMEEFWADPFPFEYQGKTWVFFEAYDYSKHLGYIACSQLAVSGNFSEPVSVLEREYHLSFPLLIEHDNTVYMIPETAQQQRVEMFKCEIFPDKWSFDRVLLDVGESVVDPVIFEQDGIWYMFVTMARTGNTNFSELHLFTSSSLFGPFKPHPMTPIKIDVRSARGAGRVFKHDGSLYRPSQDCRGLYGAAVTLNRIIELSPTVYREKSEIHLTPDPSLQSVGMHTYNVHKNIVLVDLYRWKSK